MSELEHFYERLLRKASFSDILVFVLYVPYFLYLSKVCKVESRVEKFIKNWPMALRGLFGNLVVRELCLGRNETSQHLFFYFNFQAFFPA